MQFIDAFKHYFIEVMPVLMIGFLISGVVHEFVSTKWVEKYLGKGSVRPIFYATIVGTILPICCWGSLPVALSFYKKGSRLGPVLAFLVATPATSVSALAVSYRLLGLQFTVYIFFSVIIMGMIVGLLGNAFKFTPKKAKKDICPECGEAASCCEHAEGFFGRVKSILKFAFVDMPKEIGLEIILGLLLAAVVATFVPVGRVVRLYLGGFWSYPFSLIFGLLMYFCSTASVPLVDAFITQGMNVGAGLILLLVGPITSYGTILVLRKEFGYKILSFYIGTICVISVILGYLYQLLSTQ